MRDMVFHIMKKLEQYAASLEQVVQERTQQLTDERRVVDEVLEDLLPM